MEFLVVVRLAFDFHLSFAILVQQEMTYIAFAHEYFHHYRKLSLMTIWPIQHKLSVKRRTLWVWNIISILISLLEKANDWTLNNYLCILWFDIFNSFIFWRRRLIWWPNLVRIGTHSIPQFRWLLIRSFMVQRRVQGLRLIRSKMYFCFFWHHRWWSSWTMSGWTIYRISKFLGCWNTIIGVKFFEWEFNVGML